MKNLLYIKNFGGAVLLFFTLLSSHNAAAQCAFGDNLYPFTEFVAPTTNGQMVTLSASNYYGEYGIMNLFSSANVYELNIDLGGYITVFDVTNTVVAFGPSPLIFTPPAGGTYHLQWNLPGCASSFNFSIETRVTLVGAATLCTDPAIAGSASSAPAGACLNQPFTLSMTGASIGSGLTYQWQSSSDGLSYADIALATNSSLSTTQTALTYYQCIVTCAAGTPATSVAISVPMNSFLDCYCESVATYEFDEEILNVSVGTLNNSSDCATTGIGSSVLNQYSDFTNVAAPILSRTVSYPLSLEIGTCGGVYDNMSKVFIDFNQDGTFDSSEEVYAAAASFNGPHIETGSVTIPLTAALGITKMRVINVETTDPGSITSCGNSFYGETEDYFVEIIDETFAQPNIPSYVPSNGLVGYWPFNGNANDASGNGNNGTVNGATLTPDRFGNINNAYSFDGVNDNISTLRSVLSSFSVSIWYNTIQNSAYSPLVDAYNANWELYLSNLKPTFTKWISAPSNYQEFISTNISQQNQWNQLVYTYDSGVLKIYSNNVLISTFQNVTISSNSSGYYYFGASISGSSQFYDGKLDDIGIWNRALTQQEITNLYQGSGPFNIVSSTTSTCAGQPVTLSVTALPGTISGLNCSSATNTGSLVAGEVASNVSSSIPYTGGNGGLQNGQTVSSTGVTGLTATLSGGVLNTGNGNLIYTIIGTPSAAGTASFALNIGGQTCTLTFTVSSNLAAQYAVGSVFCASGPTAVVDVTNPITGKTWMDRNLGASQVATSSTDAAAYGDLYQWGRGADGHQCRNSATTATLSSSDQPGHGLFILTGNGPYQNWQTPQNFSLWQGVNGVNNPCPYEYRLPTETEINEERLTWNNNLPNGAFDSPLKFVSSGVRSSNGGGFIGIGTITSFWTSTENGLLPRNFQSTNFGWNFYSDGSSFGFSVRCIKD